MTDAPHLPDGDGPPEEAGDESQELVRRLKALEWPKVQPEVAERCWREFSRRLEAHEPGREESRRNAGRRLDMTRYALPRRRAVRAYPRTPSLQFRAGTRIGGR